MIEVVDSIPVEPIYTFTSTVLLLLIAAWIGINFWMRRRSNAPKSLRRAHATAILQVIGWLIFFAGGASMAWQNVRYMLFSHPLGELRYPAPAVVAVIVGLAMMAISVGFFLADLRRARQGSMPNSKNRV